MAFVLKDFDNKGAGWGGAPKLATYRTADAIAVVQAAAYFNRINTSLVTGDVIFCNMSDGDRMYKVTVASGAVTLNTELLFTAIT